MFKKKAIKNAFKKSEGKAKQNIQMYFIFTN